MSSYHPARHESHAAVDNTSASIMTAVKHEHKRSDASSLPTMPSIPHTQGIISNSMTSTALSSFGHGNINAVHMPIPLPPVLPASLSIPQQTPTIPTQLLSTQPVPSPQQPPSQLALPLSPSPPIAAAARRGGRVSAAATSESRRWLIEACNVLHDWGVPFMCRSRGSSANTPHSHIENSVRAAIHARGLYIIETVHQACDRLVYGAEGLRFFKCGRASGNSGIQVSGNPSGNVISNRHVVSSRGKDGRIHSDNPDNTAGNGNGGGSGDGGDGVSTEMHVLPSHTSPHHTHTRTNNTPSLPLPPNAAIPSGHASVHSVHGGLPSDHTVLHSGSIHNTNIPSSSPPLSALAPGPPDGNSVVLVPCPLAIVDYKRHVLYHVLAHHPSHSCTTRTVSDFLQEIESVFVLHELIRAHGIDPSQQLPVDVLPQKHQQANFVDGLHALIARIVHHEAMHRNMANAQSEEENGSFPEPVMHFSEICRVAVNRLLSSIPELIKMYRNTKSKKSRPCYIWADDEHKAMICKVLEMESGISVARGLDIPSLMDHIAVQGVGAAVAAATAAGSASGASGASGGAGVSRSTSGSGSGTSVGSVEGEISTRVGNGHGLPLSSATHMPQHTHTHAHTQHQHQQPPSHAQTQASTQGQSVISGQTQAQGHVQGMLGMTAHTQTHALPSQASPTHSLPSQAHGMSAPTHGMTQTHMLPTQTHAMTATQQMPGSHAHAVVMGAAANALSPQQTQVLMQHQPQQQQQQHVLVHGGAANGSDIAGAGAGMGTGMVNIITANGMGIITHTLPIPNPNPNTHTLPITGSIPGNMNIPNLPISGNVDASIIPNNSIPSLAPSTNATSALTPNPNADSRNRDHTHPAPGATAATHHEELGNQRKPSMNGMSGISSSLDGNSYINPLFPTLNAESALGLPSVGIAAPSRPYEIMAERENNSFSHEKIPEPMPKGFSAEMLAKSETSLCSDSKTLGRGVGPLRKQSTASATVILQQTHTDLKSGDGGTSGHVSLSELSARVMASHHAHYSLFERCYNAVQTHVSTLTQRHGQGRAGVRADVADNARADGSGMAASATSISASSSTASSSPSASSLLYTPATSLLPLAHPQHCPVLLADAACIYTSTLTLTRVPAASTSVGALGGAVLAVAAHSALPSAHMGASVGGTRKSRPSSGSRSSGGDGGSDGVRMQVQHERESNDIDVSIGGATHGNNNNNHNGGTTTAPTGTAGGSSVAATSTGTGDGAGGAQEESKEDREGREGGAVDDEQYEWVVVVTPANADNLAKQNTHADNVDSKADDKNNNMCLAEDGRDHNAASNSTSSSTSAVSTPTAASYLLPLYSLHSLLSHAHTLLHAALTDAETTVQIWMPVTLTLKPSCLAQVSVDYRNNAGTGTGVGVSAYVHVKAEVDIDARDVLKYCPYTQRQHHSTPTRPQAHQVAHSQHQYSAHAMCVQGPPAPPMAPQAQRGEGLVVERSAVCGGGRERAEMAEGESDVEQEADGARKRRRT